MRIKVDNKLVGTEALPAILEALPAGLAAWVTDGQAVVSEDGVEIARVPIAGLSPEDAVDAVLEALEGVV